MWRVLDKHLLLNSKSNNSSFGSNNNSNKNSHNGSKLKDVRSDMWAANKDVMLDSLRRNALEKRGEELLRRVVAKRLAKEALRREEAR